MRRAAPEYPRWPGDYEAALEGRLGDAAVHPRNSVLPAIAFDLAQAAVIGAKQLRVFTLALAYGPLVARLVPAHGVAPMQHFLNFLPLPQRQSSFGPTFGVSRRSGFFGNAGGP